MSMCLKSAIFFYVLIVSGFLSAEIINELPYLDSEFSCTNSNAAQRYVSDYNIRVNEFGGMELCDHNVDSKKLFNDLEIVEKGIFSGSASNMFIRNIIPQDGYYNWLKNEVRSMNRGHDIPWATAYNSWGHVTMQDGWAKLSTLGRVGTLIHEARHTAGFRHYPCSHGPYAETRLAGCDTSLQQEGSHGVEMEYYSRVVLRGVNFHPVYHSMARMMNLARSNFVFNQKAMQEEEALLAVGAEHSMLETPHDLKLLNVASIDGYDVKRTSFGATFYNGDSAFSIDVHSALTNQDLVTDDYSYYKMLTMDSVEFIDIEEIDIGVRRYLVGIDVNQRIYTYVFARGEWSRPVSFPTASRLVTTSPSGLEGLFVINSDKSMCQLNPESLNCRELQERWPDDIHQFVQYKERLLALDRTGRVFDRETGAIYSPFQDMVVDQAVRIPLYNAFQL